MPLPSQLPVNFTELTDKSRHIVARRYVVDKKLGAGNFGTAFLIFDNQEEGNKKVLKQICVGTLDPGETVDAMREARLLSQLQHKNIVQFHDSFLDGQFFCIVTEFCEGGDLDIKLNEYKKKSEFVDEDQAIEWLRQLLEALQYMHEKRILHRDLKTRNIFLKGNKVKIGDFGISRILMGTSDMASTFVGTPYYMSPEVLKHEHYDEKCDVWSVGCVLFEICCLKHAFEGQSLMAVMYKIVSDHTPELPNRYSRGLNLILKKMLARDPAERQTAKELLEHPLFSGLTSPTLKPASESNANKALTPKERLRLRKQKDADEKFRKLREIAVKNFKENERRHKESFEKNFYHTSIEPAAVVDDVFANDGKLIGKKSGSKHFAQGDSKTFHPSMQKPDNHAPHVAYQSRTIAQPQLKGGSQGARLVNTIPGSQPGRDEEQGDSDATLQGTTVALPLDSTDELAASLIRGGYDIPEEDALAETYYSLHEDFETDSDLDLDDEDFVDLPDDHVNLSDTEYREMLGCMEDALDLKATTYTVKPKKQENGTLSDKAESSPRSALTNNVIDAQIEKMRNNCLEAMGDQVFKEAYSYLKGIWQSHAMPEVSDYGAVMKKLADIVPDKNKCFLLEQLVYLENEKAQEVS